jgi:hypothetical protein
MRRLSPARAHEGSPGGGVPVLPPGVVVSADGYVETTLSAVATFSAKTFGLMNCAFSFFRSSSVTPRATEHFPQTKTGTRCATTSSISSRSGGMATGSTASANVFFMR